MLDLIGVKKKKEWKKKTLLEKNDEMGDLMVEGGKKDIERETGGGGGGVGFQHLDSWTAQQHDVARASLTGFPPQTHRRSLSFSAVIQTTTSNSREIK